MKKIIVAGSLNMDMAFRVPSVPQRGETIMGEGFFMNAGGKGANQAVACARQGASVTMLGTVGNDVFGDRLTQELQAEGIDIRHLRRHPSAPTGTALILISENDNRIVVESGANGETGASQIEAALVDAEAGDVFLTQMEIPYPVVKYGLSAAKKKGLFTILNPAPAFPLDDDLLKTVDLIVPNETETEKITGIPVDQLHFTHDAIAWFLRKGVKEVIITLGSHGCAYGKSTGIWTIPAHPVEVVDTTAAGDTFVGSVAVAIASGSTVVASLSIASAAAAVTISRMGAQCSIPTTGEIQAFLESLRGKGR